MASIKRGSKPTQARKTARKAAGKPRAKRKVRRLSWFDKFIRSLPITEANLQKIFTASILAVIFFAAIIVVNAMGVPKQIYSQYAAWSAKAGFEVKSVEILGMKEVDELKVYNMIFESEDLSMPMVDLEKIRQDIIKNGWVKDVRVTRRLPDTLVIEVIEREPTAVWQHDGKYSLIDSDGIVLEDVTQSNALGLPLIGGEGANKKIGSLDALLDEAPALKPQVIGAKWVGNRRWDIIFKTGETLSLPEGDKLAADALLNFAKMDGIRRLLGQGIVRFDFRDPKRAYLQLKSKDSEKEEIQNIKTANSEGAP